MTTSTAPNIKSERRSDFGHSAGKHLWKKMGTRKCSSQGYLHSKGYLLNPILVAEAANNSAAHQGVLHKERMAHSHAEHASTDQPLDGDMGGDEHVGDGSVDLRRRPSTKSDSGQWKAAFFIMGT